jgi:hypothetical protein
MSTVEQDIAAWPKAPNGITLNFDKGYSPSDSQMLDRALAQLATCVRVLERAEPWIAVGGGRRDLHDDLCALLAALKEPKP